MASPIISSSPSRYYSLSLLSLILILLCTLDKNCFALKDKVTSISHHTHTVQLSSLLPASICSHSPVPDSEATLKVVHKHGPCSSHKSDQSNTDHAHLLQQDKARVSFIHSRRAGAGAAVISGQLDGATTLPAKSGAVVGSGNYIVTVGFGSPRRDLSLIFDTGSDVTWTQCQPCAKSCYSQKETIFDPSKSTSYANVSCTSTECSYLKSATGITPACSSVTSTCIYGIQYGDQSFSVGYFGRDTLTLTQKDVLTDYLFGCGQNNQGLFGGSAGLLGLGRNKISFVQQTASKYNRQFSYCLPASSSSTGYLSFGSTSRSSSVRYTPITTLSSTTASFYAVDVLGITVGGRKLAAATASLFKGSGTIVDSGTVITRLPPTAYAALSAEFKKQMAGYPAAPALSLLDTCFDLSKYESVTVPKVVFLFGGRAPVSLAAQGILYASSTSQVCLAFAANSDDGDVTIFGNVQQRTLRVVYDVAGGKIGFGSAGCS